jgi:hypothetical protein
MSETAQMGLFDRPAPAMHGVDEDDPNVAFVVEVLAHGHHADKGGWITAAVLLPQIGKAVTESNKRWLRAIADASRGRIAGGQHGYKLIAKMTNEEYQHWRNWMTHQSDEMRRRVIEADKIWYAKKPVD